jgi:glyoxylase-like metal-dependent hydrolase (beta-lactamase superfamily II)
MLVRTDKKAFLLAGDAIYDLEKMRSRTLPAVVWRADAMVESWELIEDYERRYNAEILIAHELDWRKKFRVAPSEWYE